MASPMVIFDFDKKSDLTNWRVVDDGVMGGLSQGNFKTNEKGNAIFYGDVSLENNGGFSSVRHRFQEKTVNEYSKFVIRLKGDRKRYQFRVKTDSYDRYSYISYFETSGEWQTIEIPLEEMYPSFRGRKLSIPNFPGEAMEEIAFLIANYKAESFKLEIDKISLK